jgi:nitrite reductase/ring-hydroxylating ferredoxin subunit/uncharacterized membrane protein
MSFLLRLSERLERVEAIDRVGKPLNDAAHRVIKTGRLKDALSGTWLGHPVHPTLVGVPIGSWLGASALDATPGGSAAARRLVGLGVVAAAPSALCGLADWSDTSGSEQRVGAVHAILNTAAVGLYSLSWLARRKPGRLGPVLSLAGAGVLAAAGYLGGHLSYAMGVGIDTNAFHTGPTDWTALDLEAGDVAEGDKKVAVAHDSSLLVIRDAGAVRVLGNRCSHRGAPLAEGEIKDGCVVCPWHDSEFEVVTGEVRRGPATQPQPVYEVRSDNGPIEVRRDEPRSLRLYPVSP